MPAASPTLALSIASLLAVASATTAAPLYEFSPVFFDDFESYVEGAALPEMAAGWDEVVVDGTNSVRVEADDGGTALPADSFGRGTGNRVLELAKTDPTQLTLRAQAENIAGLNASVARLTLDFYDADDAFVNGLFLPMGTDDLNVTGSGERAANFSLGQGSFSTSDDPPVGTDYLLGEVQRLVAFYNETGVPISYRDPLGSISDLGVNAIDLWVGASLAQDEFAAVSDGDLAITSFGFRRTGSRMALVWVDDVEIAQGFVVPEPSTGALLALAGLASAWIRRR